jgi:hypothetical protein
MLMSKTSIIEMLSRWKNDQDRHDEGVVPKPHDINAPGEMGKPVKIDNPEPGTTLITAITFTSRLFYS